MKKILLKGGGFNEDIFKIGTMRDDCNYFLYLLKNIITKEGADITTINKEGYSATIYWNYIKETYIKNAYLVVREPPCVIPDNHNLKNYKEFEKVFTWDDDLIDNKKIFKLNFAQNPPKNPLKNTGKKFCCLISSNKFSFHKDELYSERKKAINFFEKKHPEDFDLFGTRWNNFFYPFKTNIYSIFKKDFSIFKVFKYFYIILFDNNYKSYKGVVENKLIALSEYTFSICYENQKGLNGYITEKIWDCFFAGTIPIYLGCNNIEKYIPDNCFIDLRKFDGYESLYSHLKSLKKDDIELYKKNISEFIISEKAKEFYSEHWCKVIINNIKI